WAPLSRALWRIGSSLRAPRSTLLYSRVRLVGRVKPAPFFFAICDLPYPRRGSGRSLARLRVRKPYPHEYPAAFVLAGIPPPAYRATEDRKVLGCRLIPDKIRVPL